MLDPLAMDEKVVDIFLLRNIPLLLFLKSFKKAERHSNKITDLSWSINCARVFADGAVGGVLSLVLYEGTDFVTCSRQPESAKKDGPPCDSGRRT